MIEPSPSSFVAGMIVGGLSIQFLGYLRERFKGETIKGKVKLGANEITQAEWEAMRTPAPQPRRRGSNPPAPGCKPAPPAGPPAKQTIYGWGPCQLEPPPPPPGTRRVYIWSRTIMAECGGPCYEAQDPSACTCGSLWRDVPLPPEMDPRFGVPWDEGTVQRGNGHGGPNHTEAAHQAEAPWWAHPQAMGMTLPQTAPLGRPRPAPAPAAAEPPLWRVMDRAYNTLGLGWTDGEGYTLEILAVRDWLFPGGRPDVEGVSDDCLSIFDELTTEAARAEAGE